MPLVTAAAYRLSLTRRHQIGHGVEIPDARVTFNFIRWARPLISFNGVVLAHPNIASAAGALRRMHISRAGSFLDIAVFGRAAAWQRCE